MRLLRTLVSIVFVTTLALAYVHQQVELVKLSYAIDIKDKHLKEMLDRKEKLRYNIENLEAPSRLEKILISKKLVLDFPKRGDVFRVASADRSSGNIMRFRRIGLERKTNILGILDFFSPRAEAQTRDR